MVRTEDINSTCDVCSENVGKIEAISRGETHWLITIPEDGSLPIHQGAPALIQWQADPHPAMKLKDHGLSLVKLQIYNPEAERISDFLNSINFVGNVEVLSSNESKLVALINTSDGIRELSA